MPVLGAYFLHALFADMQRYKDCANEQKEMPAFIPFLASIYIMYARTFLISYLKYHDLLSSSRSSLFSFLFHLAHILRICAQSSSCSQIRKLWSLLPPPSVLVQAFALLFWLCILLLSFVPSSLVGCSDRSRRLSQPRFLVLS